MPNRKRVPFQEDDSLIRRTCGDWLAEAGLEPILVEDNAEARRALSDPEEFDLVVLNIQLPDGDGRDLCAELRQSGVTAPVLVQSGYDSLRDFEQAMRAGADDFLTKPFNKDQLLERIQFLLDLPPVQRRSRSRSATSGTNLPTPGDLCIPRIDSALAFLESVRPQSGTLPRFNRSDDGPRPVPLDEEMAAELEQTLKQARELLASREVDLDVLARVRALLLQFAKTLAAWLGARATVITDESLKIFVKAAAATYVANSIGLKIDLMHLVALLGALAHPGP